MLAKEAGRAIQEIYQRNAYDIQLKPDASPVTTADLLAHRIIETGLHQINPHLPILSEEGRTIDFKERSTWTHFWLVDPLDGTKEFIQQTGEFTVNIALIEGHSPVLGVVVAPFLQRAYWALRGGGAFFQQGVRPIKRIRANTELKFPVKVAMSRHHLEEEPHLNPLLRRLKSVETVYCGSALKICLVAEGTVDLYPRFGPTGAWDTAAGQCILEAAGGQLINLQGQPLTYNTGPSLVNPAFSAVSCVDLLPYVVDKLT